MKSLSSLSLAVLLIVIAAMPLAVGADGPLSDPPLVQMLVPGFEVQELPLRLSNINNLRYRRDGKLYALGYDGNISLLSDTTGDGLEDTATRFFENKKSLRGPIGMAVIPDDHPLLAETVRDGKTMGCGVVVASKGKVSAILDLDGDDVADEERVIATGWKEIPPNVDTIGVAIHPVDGSIYFGLGTAAYNNAYLIDSDGRSQFDLASQRGTIQRIAADLSGRTTVCTGIRFTIGMAFDQHNELFVSDQEGATWLPNGNPFDELLHIRQGEHYGFPPRHPRHLPHVFDQPSLFDYGPQHQSTCGIAFNRPVLAGGPIFGPEHWRDDLFVCGQSRGKLYRTRLVRDNDGDYVAQNHLIGCLRMLTVDCCVSPLGDLIVACHSGGPDWGSGPSGEGKLIRIRYAHPDLPQPLMAWSASANEVRIAFDRPLQLEHLNQLAARTTITHGPYVAAGDRFESIRPGYAIVKMQQAAPRHPLAVHSAGVSADRRSLILATAPNRTLEQYAITLPGLGREQTEASATATGADGQHPVMDLAYTLHGVVAKWQGTDQQQAVWEGWLPHTDLQIAEKLHPQPAELARFAELIQQPGELTLAMQIDPRGWMVPAVQPGATLDYDPKDDPFILEQVVRIVCNEPFRTTVDDGGDEQVSTAVGGVHQQEVVIPKDAAALMRLVVRCRSGKVQPQFQMTWAVKLGDGSTRSGPVPPHRLVVPWAELGSAESPPPRQEIAQLAGANWGRGRQVFHSTEAACSRCHVAHGSGGEIGPDLSNLVERDYASVLRDVVHPDYAINPDYVTYAAMTIDGRVFSGVVRNHGDRVLISDRQGTVTELHVDEIAELQPSAASTMPTGLAEQLGPERMKDLLAFLLQPAPRMPQDAAAQNPEKHRPPKRTRAEVTKRIDASRPAAGTDQPTATGPPAAPPLRLLLVAGAKDHGPGEHDYPAWLRAWNELLSAAPGVSVETAMDWPSADQLQAADTIVFYQKGTWSAERAAAIDRHLAKGGGLVYIHWAVEGAAEAEAFAQRIGLASDARKTKYRHGPLEIDFTAGQDHPITRGLGRVAFHDESYWALQGDAAGLNILGTAIEADRAVPLFWTLQPGRGRVFVSIPGHYSWTFDDPVYRLILLRGIAWASGAEVDRMNELATLGVDWQD